MKTEIKVSGSVLLEGKSGWYDKRNQETQGE
jgi:hypothetical protein